MRMIKKAAEVLNDADDFGRKLAVILFQQEVAYIWDGTHEWKPGDPIFKRPNCWLAVGQQYIRPMFEEFEDGDAVSGRLIRCKECDTYWRGDEPCFSCGEIVPAHAFDESPNSSWMDISQFVRRGP